MFKKNFSIAVLALVLTLILVPAALAQTTDFEDINFEDYDLDLSTEEMQELKDELKEVYDDYEEIDEEAIRDMLEEMDTEETEEDEGQLLPPNQK
jgi:peptidoglycan hydrolase CwlO-like protein